MQDFSYIYMHLHILINFEKINKYYSCTFDCIGGTVHNNDARQTRSSVLQYINCLYCSRKIYNTCDLELKNFIRNEASEFVAVEGRLQIPLQTRRKYKCETCRATDRQKRVDLRCRSFAVSTCIRTCCIVIIIIDYFYFFFIHYSCCHTIQNAAKARQNRT